jgi:predicted HAD superfamily hydrolase
MSDKKYRFISLDLWDTVIRRKCHPDEIKIHTARYLFIKYNNFLKWQDETVYSLVKSRIECEKNIGNITKKSGFDDEYDIKDVFRLWVSNSLSNLIIRVEEVVEELYYYELECEKRNSYLDPTIIKTINAYKYEKIGYISDFYAGTEFLDEIIKSIGFPIEFDIKMVSCEQKCNKRSGRLFNEISNQFGIQPVGHLHIGDNLYSDFKIPKKMGIDTLHYIPEEEHKKRIEKEADFSYEKRAFVEKCSNYPIKKATEEISVFFYGFASWILEQCINQGIEKIYFFTREGEFYKKVYDAIVSENPYYIKAPESQLLEVSRIATFGASLREVTIQEMMRIWNQYSCQSMKALFSSIGVNVEEVQSFLDKYKLPVYDMLTYPWEDERVQNMFEDRGFIETVNQTIENQKKYLLQYCSQRGINKEEKGKIAIVDIGWRGTIQDNLCYVFPNYDIYGYYIGLIPFLNAQPQNSYKEGYINNYKNHHALLMLSTPFEMICNSPNGSTVKYEEKDGRIVAVRKKEEGEDRIYFEYTEKIQKMVIQKMKDFVALSEQHYLTEMQFREQAYASLEHFIFEPDSEFAKTYFKLVHNEEFGVGNYIDKRTRFRPFLMIKALVSSKSRNELKDFLRNTTWPQGYFVKYHLYPALHLYNKILLKYYKR